MPIRDEFELKIAIPREQLAALRHHALMQSAVRREGKRVRLVTTYFDTAKHALAGKGLALRIRRDGAKSVQTLKANITNGGGIQHRREFENEIRGARPDLSLIDPRAIKRFFGRTPKAHALKPVFTTEIEREQIPLRFADTEIKLAVDVGRIRSGKRSEDVCEVEFELLSGQKTRLFELALALSEHVAFRIESRTKAERGYRLSTEASAGPVKAKPLDIHGDANAGDGFETVARACLEQLRANETSFLETEDPEAIHQIRVSIRRFRAALALFRKVLTPAPRNFLREELKWLQRSFGGARDIDVFSASTLGRIADDEASTAVANTIAEMRREAFAETRRTLISPRYVRLLLKIELWLDDHKWLRRAASAKSLTVREFTRCVFDKWYRRVRDCAGDLQWMDDAALHDFRLRAKKLRYALEFTASAHSKRRVEKLRAPMARIQDVLGAVNDVATANAILDELSRRNEKGTVPFGSVQTVIEKLRREQASALAVAKSKLPLIGRKLRAAKRS